MFMPLGALVPAITRRLRSAPAVVLFALLVSASIEGVQFAEQRIGVGRTVDIDDVLWNVLGAYAGYRVAARVTAAGAARQ
jgi:glycopeptide antibiotics resistance protein